MKFTKRIKNKFLELTAVPIRFELVESPVDGGPEMKTITIVDLGDTFRVEDDDGNFIVIEFGRLPNERDLMRMTIRTRREKGA